VLEQLTFLLAVLGYAGLAATAVRSARGRLPVTLWRPTASVIVVHVLLVWTLRYDWQIAQATRNGYLGFVIFHAALMLIVTSLGVAERHARVLVWIAFGIVTPGALGAVFLYEVVAGYRVAVIAIAVAGLAGLGWAVMAQHVIAFSARSRERL
jgi:hypothetical protein